MTNFTKHPHGQPSWVDLMSPDVDKSKEFYSALFGWDADDQFDDDGNRIYTMFRRNGQDVAGLGGQMPGMEGMPGVWNSYVSVDDAEAITKKVEAAGGTVMAPPMQVMDSGSMAIFQDPAGAVFSVWQPDTMIGAQVGNEPNTYAWNELMSRDVETAKGFYADVFGWEYDGMDMGPMGIYNVVRGGENEGLAGLMTMPAEMPEQVPNHWNVYFMAEDVDALAERVTQLGGSIVNPPMDSPVGRLATFHDPQNGSFSVMQPAEHHEA